MIPNPTPITATFSGMWFQNVRILINQDGTSDVNARVAPYDPETEHLLATRVQDIRTTLDSLLTTTIRNEMRRQADTTRDVKAIHVAAREPTNPVVVVVVFFTEGRPHLIRDAYALAATDATFDGVFQSTMLAIAEEI